MTRTEILDQIITDLKKLGPEGSRLTPLTDVIAALAIVVKNDEAWLSERDAPHLLEKIINRLDESNELLREIRAAINSHSTDQNENFGSLITAVHHS